MRRLPGPHYMAEVDTHSILLGMNRYPTSCPNQAGFLILSGQIRIRVNFPYYVRLDSVAFFLASVVKKGTICSH